MKSVFFFVFISLKITGQSLIDNEINGVFMIDQCEFYSSPTCNYLSTNNGVAAYFSDIPLLNILPVSFFKIAEVKFNNTTLDYNSSNNFYAASKISDVDLKKWEIKGAGTIPNMGFIYNGVLPSFTIDQTIVNDTIKKSDTLFVHLNNVLNTDSIMINICDDSQLTVNHSIALISRNIGNIYYLPPALFSRLTVGPRSLIKIEAINSNYQTISGKRYLFKNKYSFVLTNVNIVY